MQEGGQGSSGPGGFGGGGFGGGRGKFFDDLAGMAGGAFSVLSGARAEIESAVQAQVEALTARLNLVKREELDAALEVARRAREQAEALALRVDALEARMNSAPPDATPFETGAATSPVSDSPPTGSPATGSPATGSPATDSPGEVGGGV